jgi:hypothetical protein
MATLAVQLDEDALVRDEIAQISLPEGVSFSRVAQGSDWMGDPAVHVYFVIAKRMPLTKKRIAAFAALREEATYRILAMRLGRWPIIHFEDGV